MVLKRFAALLFAVLAGSAAQAQFIVGSLSVEHMHNPSTVDSPHPRLSWVNVPASPSSRGNRQSAYRIVVATSPENLAKGNYDLWDSGRQLSDRSTLIPYQGAPLRSGDDCFWMVQTWDADGQASAWSPVGHWGMGLLSPTDWKARWIASDQPSGAPLFRKAFSLKDNIVKAKAFVSAGGYFELYVNGIRVGNDCLVPNFTNYTSRPGLDKGPLALDPRFSGYRILYLSYDITHLLRPSDNAVGAILGDGFYRCSSRWVRSFGTPCFLCQVEVTYSDGSKDTVATDSSWLTHPSPITMTGIYDGETYDARLELPLWASPACNEQQWHPASLATPPIGRLSAHTSPTDRICEVLQPLRLTKNDDGSFEASFEKEVSGWVRLSGIHAKPGQKVKVHYLCESPLGSQEYICKGSGSESYAPRFTWFVFSKVVVRGLDSLAPDQIQAEAVNTDVPVVSSFHTDNPLLNTIHRIWIRTQLDNMHGCVPSDCPHRERSPYTGDGQIAAAMVMLHFDAAAFYQKWLRDIRDAQNPASGYVPNGAPWQPGCGGGVAWGAAMNTIPWEFFLHYGDSLALRVNFIPMKNQLRHMLSWLTPDGTMLQQKLNEESKKPCFWFNLGDWVPPFGMPDNEIIHTFYLWLCADYTARAASALGEVSDFETFHALAERTKAAFHRKFYNVATKSYGDFGPNVLALWMGLPDDRKADVVATLRNEIMLTHTGHIHTGFVASKFLFEALSRNGLHDVAMAVVSKEDFPSYGHWIRQGATTMWENWNGQDSRNHPMFGGGLTWLSSCLAGISPDPSGAGYRHFSVRPFPSPGLDTVCFSTLSPQGRVASRVVCHDGKLSSLEVSVPVGSTASVVLPAPCSSVKESGRRLKKGNGILSVSPATDSTLVELSQGTYSFSIKAE